MTLSLPSNILAATLLLLALSSCGNTIRGMGRDTANAVNATQDAGRSVDRAGEELSPSIDIARYRFERTRQ